MCTQLSLSSAGIIHMPASLYGWRHGAQGFVYTGQALYQWAVSQPSNFPPVSSRPQAATSRGRWLSITVISGLPYLSVSFHCSEYWSSETFMSLAASSCVFLLLFLFSSWVFLITYVYSFFLFIPVSFDSLLFQKKLQFPYNFFLYNFYINLIFSCNESLK